MWTDLAIPVAEQQGKADPEKPRGMCTLTAFWGQRGLRAPFGLLTAVTPEREGALPGGWQGREGCLGPPFHQQMDMPIPGLQQTAQAPHCALGWRPAGACCQGCPSWVQGWHADQPTQEEAIPAFPHAGHPATQDRDEQGHRGDGEQSRQHRASSVGHQKSAVSEVSFSHTATLPLMP
jgi:hypothetical protein